jgi:asparagine synthase (glutamine-hydrolysing)
MTLLAGILSRRNRPLPDSVCASLAQSISREGTDEVKSFSGRSSCFAKVDIGAFGESGIYVDSAGALSLLAGEALLSNPETNHGSVLSSSRLQDLTTIHEQGLRNNWDVLSDADGTFCIVHYQPESDTLTLVADKLGIRPLYYWLDDDLVVFASALRILEECPLVPKKMDLRAVTEMVGLDYPLADRTPYAGIALLKPAEVLQVAMGKISRRCYWRWDEIEVSPQPEQARLALVYDHFQSAVNRRIRNDRATSAYLSGGLDSRCVVAALSEHSVRMHTVNFARPGTQDYYCGNQFAERIESTHQCLPRDDAPDFSLLMANAINGFNENSDHGRQFSSERPRLVWSGEGGSVLLGHVHLSESIIELMRAGDVDGAIDAYVEMEQIHVSPRLFRAHLLENVRDLIKQGIREELEQLHCADPGRNFYLFLVLNDQRRKLKSHFENIDQHRLEFQLPFFDGQFLSSIMGTELDLCIRHKFYNKWLLQFPPVVAEVPWQAYPGHEPCLLPLPAELGYQWDHGRQAKEDASQKHRVLKQATELLRAANFPDKILNRRNLRLAVWIHARGWRDYRYAFRAAQTYHAYSQRCGGEFILEVVGT